MKMKFLLIAVCSFFSVNFLFSQQDFQGISGINFDNYPIVDGSTSSRALNQMIACKLLGVRYEWVPNIVLEWYLSANQEDIPEQHKDFFQKNILTSQTNGAFMNLIDGKVDVILTHRIISPDEKAYAETKGVSLIETPIALDAFVFVVHKSNPVKTLTVNEIQEIYTKEITNWSEVGGNNVDIKVFTRPRNSGSEEVFREVVMKGLEPSEFPESAIGGMAGVFTEINANADAICYTFMNYKEMITRISDNVIPKLSINGVFPNETTVKNRTFPFISEVHVAIRSDLDQNSMAYKLYEWLQTPSGKSVAEESGFFPYETSDNSIKQISNQRIQILPNPTEGIIEIRGIEDYSNLNYEVYNSIGQIIQSGSLKQTIDLSNRKGLNILTIMQNQQIIAREKIMVR